LSASSCGTFNQCVFILKVKLRTLKTRP
jgi:hypothetical protein